MCYAKALGSTNGGTVPITPLPVRSGSRSKTKRGHARVHANGRVNSNFQAEAPKINYIYNFFKVKVSSMQK